MNALISRFRLFVTSEDGPTSVEYALMVGLISAALITSISALSGNIQGIFSAVAGSI
jgi:pilus assembly protein Flp/PilA